MRIINFIILLGSAWLLIGGATAQDESLAITALAYDLPTRQIVMIDADGSVTTIAEDVGNDVIVPTPLTVADADSKPSIVAVAIGGDGFTGYDLDGNAYPHEYDAIIRNLTITPDGNAFYYGLDDSVIPYRNTFFDAARIYGVNLITGEELDTPGYAVLEFGCGGMSINAQENVIWQESRGFGRKRAIERVDTAAFDGFIGTVGACDEGVFAADFAEDDPSAARILSEWLVDWVIAPDGARVAGHEPNVGGEGNRIMLIDLQTGEQTEVTTGPYERVTWLDDSTLLASERIETSAFVAEQLPADVLAAYSALEVGPQPPEDTPIFTVRMVSIDVASGEVTPLTEMFPNAYSLIRTHVVDDTIYAAVIPDGVAVASMIDNADPDDIERAFLPYIYAVELETGVFEQVAQGYLYWTPMLD